MESLRIFKLLVSKNFLVRKRQWVISLLGEIVVPVIIVACILAERDSRVDPPKYIKDETYYKMQSKEEMIEFVTTPNKTIEMYFAPQTDFTRQLMEGVKSCFNDRAILHPFTTEEEIIENHYEAIQDAIVIIFDGENKNSSTKTLKYKIRGVHLNEVHIYSILSQIDLSKYYTETNYFVQTQFCLDETFIKMKLTSTTQYPKIYAQQMPYPPYTKHSVSDTMLTYLFSVISMIVFMIPLFIEISRVANEKFLGINILMSMNGVSNSLNLLSYLISGVIFFSIFCILPILVMMLISTGHALPYIYYSDPFIIFLVYIFHISHLLAMGLAESATCSKLWLLTFSMTHRFVTPIILQFYHLDQDTYYIAPYLGILFPNILLFRAIDELNYYEAIGKGIQWNNLFEVGKTQYEFGGSTGMVLILSLLGMLLHFLLAIYIYAIKPGKYGVKRSALFCLKRANGKHEDSEMITTEDKEADDSLFESVPKGVCISGIQIRNLEKTYKFGLFNRSKVHALRGVSMDLYKGQITSLLGHNGAGKTTMISILTGMTKPSNGSVFVNDKDMKYHANEIMNGMGLCTEQNMVFPNLSVKEQLQFFAMLKEKDKSKAPIEQDVQTLLDKLKLKDEEDFCAEELSGSKKRRLCLGMALISDSSILILDEPTSGLDPESKRVIWDILLKMRGKKTILISTHDMEEADILGDRIAVLHEGKLKSYGTPMFLKKLLGQNNIKINLSIEPWCDQRKILQYLNVDANTIYQDNNKMIITIPNTADMPDLLDNIDEKKEELGISGFSASPISLEKVFLKLTRSENPYDYKPFDNTNKDPRMKDHSMKPTQALLHKKLTYTLKNISTIIAMLILILVVFFSTSSIFRAFHVISTPRKKLIPLQLNIYSQPETYYKVDGNFGRKYKNATTINGGTAFEVQNSSLTEAFMKQAKENLAHYSNHLIAGAEFNKTNEGIIANAFYSGNATFGFPIAVNLLSNTIAKTLLGNEYSISSSSQGIPSLIELQSDQQLPIIHYFITSTLFVFFFCPAVALFVLHPLKESSSGIKHLQMMTGVSGFIYWGTMFFFDMLVYLLIICLVVIGFSSVDLALDLNLYPQQEEMMLMLTLVMFAVNSLPFFYIFSFMKTTTSNAIRLLTYIPLSFVTLDIIMYTITYQLGYNAFVKFMRAAQKRIFLFVPYVSFFHSQVAFHRTTQINARCKNLPNIFYEIICQIEVTSDDVCCVLECHNGECKRYKTFFTNFDDDITMEESLIFLSVTPFVYFGILIILEYQWFQKFKAKIKNQNISDNSTDQRVIAEKISIAQKIDRMNYNELRYINANCTTSNDQVLQENSFYNSNINGTNSNGEDSSCSSTNQEFVVSELHKYYGKRHVVNDVNFRVNKNECFGLFGVNGAGKSATFRMITGAEIPDHGVMYIGDKDMKKNRKFFLSQIGYCPQYNAIMKSLNAYDHLRLFARLRGIPEDRVEDEIELWIQRLNLDACASQPSGTYSAGNKRRLNIAIALIGIPNLVLMDEPTMGVDPGARRSLWKVIKSCQMMGQAIVLSSHSMEECEALCDRLAIMVDGQLVCIGPSQELKQRFGAGYDIQIKLDLEKTIEQINDLKNDMIDKLNCKLVDENLGYLMYHVTPTNTTWRMMYNVMNAMRSKYDWIDDFSIQSSKLEQLFLTFARNDEKIFKCIESIGDILLVNEENAVEKL